MLTARFAFFYLTYFAGLGVMLPWFNVYFETLGMSGFRIGILTAIVPMGKMVFPTIWARRADRSGRRRQLTIVACFLSVGATGAFLFVETFFGLALACIALSLVDGPRLPMVEATTMDLTREGRLDYGRARAWGSVGFILAAVAVGAVVGAGPIRIVLHATLLFAALNAAAALFLPEAPVVPAPGGASLRSFVRQRRVVVFFAACMLMQASHGAYYAFFSIHMQREGYARGSIGLLWGLGVAAEIVIMFLSRSLSARFAPVPVMIGCTLVAGARWGLLAASAHPVVVVAAQMLHAFTFAAFHIAAVSQTHRIFPRELHASGQGLLGGITYGLGTVTGAFVSGFLFDLAGAWRMFGTSAAIALAGTLALTAFRLFPHNRRDRGPDGGADGRADGGEREATRIDAAAV